MVEAGLQDEEIKKKKRRVLVVLLVLLLGTAAMLPLTGGIGSPSAAAPEPTPVPPTHTAAPTDTPLPPTHEPTETSAPTDTPEPTATATHIPVLPTATEELGGAGGGEMDASPSPTGAPTDTPQPTATPTPEGPDELPVTGTNAVGSGRLVLGLAAISLGTLLLAAGSALRKGGMPVTASRSAPVAVDVPPASKEPGQPFDADAAAPATPALGLVAAALALMLVAGYALHRARKH